MNRILCFDIWAEYAHFKKYYTTTSPLTFSIPPKTTIYGIVGAIIGLDKDDYLNHFSEGKCKIGLQINKPVKKTRINLNLINTKTAPMMSRIKTRTQIKTEFLKNAGYRIYLYHEDDSICTRLKDCLQEHKTVYSVSLGLSENLANFKYIGEYSFEKVVDNHKYIDILTVLRISENLSKGDIDFNETGKEYFSDKVALEMKPDRVVTDYGQIVYERNGKSIKARPKEYYHLENGKKIYLI